MTGPIRVVIADDQPLVRDGLRAILSAVEDIDVVGDAEDGEAAVAAVERLGPDVVLMDVRMPRLDGLGAARRILERGGLDGPRVVVITTFDEDEYIFTALELGCSGFLLKGAPRDAVITAVRAAAADEGMIDQAVTRRVIEELGRRLPGTARPPAPAEPVADPRLADLTARELDVLRLIADGLSNAEIAERLVVAPGTVKTHVRRILMKLGLRDRVQAVVLAHRLGVAVPAEP